MKCTKCGKELANGSIFCSGCGTKQYVQGEAFKREGKLVLNIKKCSIYRMGVIPVNCEFRFYDNRIEIVDSSDRYQLSAVPTQVLSFEVTDSLLGGSKKMKINTVQLRPTVISFPQIYSDFVPYLLNMLTAWKKAPL